MNGYFLKCEKLCTANVSSLSLQNRYLFCISKYITGAVLGDHATESKVSECEEVQYVSWHSGITYEDFISKGKSLMIDAIRHDT